MDTPMRVAHATMPFCADEMSRSVSDMPVRSNKVAASCGALGRGGWLIFLVVAACASRSADLPQGELPGDIRPQAYVLDLDIDPRATRFGGRVVIDVELMRPLRHFFLHGRDLDVTAVTLRQQEKTIAGDYRQLSPDGVARIELAATAEAGPATLTLTYNAPFSPGLEGLFRVEVDGRWYAFSQFEPLDARRAFPGFDQPSFKTPFTIRVRAPAEDVVITSTRSAATTMLEDGRRQHQFARSVPLPTYLIAFAVGPLDVLAAGEAGGVPLRGVATHGRIGLMARALADTPTIVARLAAYFARPYPFDKLDIVAMPGQLGAMENVGAVTYSEDLILLDADSPVSQLRSYFGVHVHELAHQWFGNLVTMKWWNDVWLNEAFADWMATKLSAELQPAYGFSDDAIREAGSAMRVDSLATTRRIREPVRNANDAIGAFDSITYTKGAAVLAMLEGFVGTEPFQRGVQNYLREHAFSSADVNDFAQALAQSTAQPAVAAMLRSFVDQPGVPEVEVSRKCSSAGNVIELRQRRYVPLGSRADAARTWRMPVCMRLPGRIAAECRVMASESMRVDVGEECPAWVMPNADGLGYYRFALPQPEFAALLDVMADALTRRERIAVVDNLIAAVVAGRVPVTALLDRAMVLAGSGERQLVTAPIDLWNRLDVFALNGNALESSRSRRTAVYKAALRRALSEDDALLSAQLIDTLARRARDTEVRNDLSQRARRFVGFDAGETPDRSALPRDWLDTALIVAVEDIGTSFVAHLVARLPATRDPLEREAMLIAVAAAPDPGQARALLDGESLRGQELFTVASHLLAPERIAINAQWMIEHLQTHLPRYASFGHVWLVSSFGNYCTAAAAQALPAQLAPLLPRLEGGPRMLAQTVEQIELCAAFVTEQGPAAQDYFEHQRWQQPPVAISHKLGDGQSSVPVSKRTSSDGRCAGALRGPRLSRLSSRSERAPKAALSTAPGVS
jgi:alanyl aminopeptidase